MIYCKRKKCRHYAKFKGKQKKKSMFPKTKFGRCRLEHTLIGKKGRCELFIKKTD